MSRCPNCAADMRFDIATQSLVCDYCGTSMDPYESKEAKEARENDMFDVTVFTCPQCGGEIMSTENMATSFCSYCGASVVLEGRISKARRPQKIIPFQKTKDDCKKLYALRARRALFAPDEMKNPEALEKFRGIYLPYWAFSFTQSGQVTLKGKREKGNYTEYCRLQCDLDGSYQGISYDASAPFDDHIADIIAPFHQRGMKAFSPAFLSGFYADIADVKSTVYEIDAENRANNQAMQKIERQYAGISITEPKDMTSAFHTRLEQVESAMFPVWFLTWRRGDRVAYAVVNGETGKVSADLPVDTRKYLLGSLLLSIPVFILLMLFLNIKSSMLLVIAMIFGIAAAAIYSLNMRELGRREQRLDDRGYQSLLQLRRKAAADRKLEEMQREIVASGGSLDQKKIAEMKKQLYKKEVYKPAGASEKAKAVEKNTGLFLGMVIVSMVVSVLIIMQEPISDIPYYGGAILLLASICCMLLNLISKYNLLATRPIPELFNRKGGNDGAKDN